MKSLRNKVQLIGNLGMDPEVKEAPLNPSKGGKGKQVASSYKLAKFSLATNESYKNQKGDKVEETQWHNLIAWGKTAEIVEKYLKKGNRVAIEGKLVNRSYEDKEGTKRYITEIVVDDLMMLDGKGK